MLKKISSYFYTRNKPKMKQFYSQYHQKELKNCKSIFKQRFKIYTLKFIKHHYITEIN